MASLLDDQDIIPRELDNLRVGEIAAIFGAGWDDFALKCFASVVAK
jgi:hypothetical protein